MNVYSPPDLLSHTRSVAVLNRGLLWTVTCLVAAPRTAGKRSDVPTIRLQCPDTQRPSVMLTCKIKPAWWRWFRLLVITVNLDLVTLAILCVWRNLEAPSALVYVSANIRTGVISSKSFRNYLPSNWDPSSWNFMPVGNYYYYYYYYY